MTDCMVSSEEEKSAAHEANDAALTEAVRHIDIVHTSLAGMTAIVLMLLGAVALPVFGRPPVIHLGAFIVMTAASFVGIAGLYFLNFQVHKHVTDQARLNEVLVNSLGQGFVVFERDGQCGRVYSQACLDLLEIIPAEKNIAEVLRVPEEQYEDFKDWIDVLFQPDHALGFEDVIRFFPSIFPHSGGRRVSLVYRPIKGPHGRLKAVVLIATDRTEEYAARQAARRQQNFAEMICRIFKDRNQFSATLAHVRDFLDKTEKINGASLNIPSLLRELHTLKASLKQFYLLDFSEIVHEVENELRDPEIDDDKTFLARLETSRAKIAGALARASDEIFSLIGKECEWRGNVREIAEDDVYAFAEEMTAAHADPALVQRYLEKVVAVPIRDCFHSFERELRELIGAMEKQVKPILFEGSNPKVLTRPLQELLFSLTHICRNIADHGIELPVTRMARDKDAAGQVTILCELVPAREGTGKDLRIVIGDDGNGIDPGRVRAKLATTDPEGTWRFEDDTAVIQRVLSFGFTTTEKVTTLSGRGVGLEAVEMEVRKLGGTIRVSSELYKGARFDIRVPYVMRLQKG